MFVADMEQEVHSAGSPQGSIISGGGGVGGDGGLKSRKSKRRKTISKSSARNHPRNLGSDSEDDIIVSEIAPAVGGVRDTVLFDHLN